MTIPSPRPLATNPAQKYLRPKDAASLLLVDREGDQPRILMGRRQAGLAFMPGKFVFPGGRADPSDGSITAANELSTHDTDKLLVGMGARASLRRARALGLCAIRETFEETGLRIAQPSVSDTIMPENQDWYSFFDTGIGTGALPALGDLRYFARAITPPGNVRRFDARFFIAFRDNFPDLAKQHLVSSGELEELDWIPISEIEKLDVARITGAILKEAQSLLNTNNYELPAILPVVQYNKRHGHFVREVI